jgi:hypothetical protein
MSLVTPVTVGAFANAGPDIRAIALAWQTAAKRATEKQLG